MANDWTALKASIKRGLNQKAGDDTGTWDDSEYLAEANFYMREIVNRCGCLSSETTFNSVKDQGEYAEKADVNKVISCYFDDGNGFVPLERTSVEELDRYDKGGLIGSPWREERGDPVAWYPDAPRGVVGFYPIPDAAGTDNLMKKYKEQVTEMTVGGSVPFNGEKNLYDFHRLIAYGTIIHFLDIDGEDSSKWERRYEAGIRSLKKKVSQNYTMLSFDLMSRKHTVKRNKAWPLGR